MSAPTTTPRDKLAELVNGRPVPVNPRTVGGIYERDTAYQRADAIIAAGWRAPVEHWGCNGHRLPGASWCACGATVFNSAR
jgi:hypothetical protein